MPERWNLVFLDFQYKQFNKKLLKNLPINLLYTDEEICCRFLKTENCECPQDFNLQENFLILITNILVNVLKTMQDQNLEFTTNLKCDDSQFNEATRNRFYEILQKEIDSNDLVYKENFGLHININGGIEIENGETPEKVAKYNYKSGVSLLDGKKIEPITPFFRIGITHVSIFLFLLYLLTFQKKI